MGKKEEVALRIRTMRKSRDMTQEDLARAIGQSASSITMYETARREPDLETLEAFADVFNVPISAIVGDDIDIEEIPQSDDIRLLIRGLNKLSPEQVRQAKEVMKAMFAKYADYFERESDDES